jgi:hypothetical protein
MLITEVKASMTTITSPPLLFPLSSLSNSCSFLLESVLSASCLLSGLFSLPLDFHSDTTGTSLSVAGLVSILFCLFDVFFPILPAVE